MSPAENIARALEGFENEIDLGRVALEIARTEYPELDQGPYLRRLDELARDVRPPRPDPLTMIEALNTCLFARQGFHGNTEDYYDPRNSFLNDVLDRRTGIPITLSAVYMEVARRLDFPICGVGMPGHFLVKYPGEPELFVDPFHGGRILMESDCEQRLRELYGPEAHLEPAFLEAVTKKQMVTRMLHNLKGIYFRNRQFRKAVAIEDILLAIYPRSAEDYRQRGALHLHLENSRLAVADFERYLELAPGAADAQEVRQSLSELKRLLARLN